MTTRGWHPFHLFVIPLTMRQNQEYNGNFSYILPICDKCFTFFKIISSLRLELLNSEPRKILLKKYAY